MHTEDARRLKLRGAKHTKILMPRATCRPGTGANIIPPSHESALMVCIALFITPLRACGPWAKQRIDRGDECPISYFPRRYPGGQGNPAPTQFVVHLHRSSLLLHRSYLIAYLAFLGHGAGTC